MTSTTLVKTYARACGDRWARSVAAMTFLVLVQKRQLSWRLEYRRSTVMSRIAEIASNDFD
jgi:hypothetical protein